MKKLQITTSFPESCGVRIGVIEALNCSILQANITLEERLSALLELRSQHELLDEVAEQHRLQARDMLRNGSYKPTGRAKPASEYLLRAAQEKQFPRINTLVDINNYISLKYMIPISLWDMHKAESTTIHFRLGNADESFVFNSGGQIISVHDLVAGFSVHGDTQLPRINPVKDALATKTDEHSKNIGVAVYYPSGLMYTGILDALLDEFCFLLTLQGAEVEKGVY